MNKYLIGLLLIILGCNSGEIEQETVIIKTPIKYPDGTSETFSSQINISYYKGKILYDFPKYISESMDGIPVLDSIGHDYVLIKSGDSTAYFFTSLHQKDLKLRHVGSFLKDRIIEIIHADSIFKYINKSDVINHTHDENEYRYKYNVTGIDSIYIFTAKNKEKFNYSFSRQLDSFFKNKVVKIEFLATFDSSYEKEDRRISFSLSKGKFADKNEILSIFQKTKN